MKIKYKIEDIAREVKYKIQRAKNGYADIDTWSFEEYVARLINENCYKLAEQGSSYPNGMTDDKWRQILLDISFGFGSYLEMRSGIYSYKDEEFKRLSKEYRNGLKLFSKYHQYLWD